MLRVGLTGGLGSGKTTVAKQLAARGAHVLESDIIGRELLLHSDGDVYKAIVAHFGSGVVRVNGELDRGELAHIAFTEGRVEELNAIVHPAVLARQEKLIASIAAHNPDAVIIVESALIFETKHGGKNGWRSRFDCVILVTARESLRIKRYIQRMIDRFDIAERAARRIVFASEARRRMEHQIPDDQKIPLSDYVIYNNGSLAHLEAQVDALWLQLQRAARTSV